MSEPLRISILGKDYTLRVEQDMVEATREMAEYLDSQLRAFKTAHPEQSDLTAAIITGLAVTEKLFNERADKVDPGKAVNAELDHHEQLGFVAVAKDYWTIEAGFLTPTMKMKRAKIEEEYGGLMEGWYAENKPVVWQG